VPTAVVFCLVEEFVGGSETCVIFGAVMDVTVTVFEDSAVSAAVIPGVFILTFIMSSFGFERIEILNNRVVYWQMPFIFFNKS